MSCKDNHIYWLFGPFFSSSTFHIALWFYHHLSVVMTRNSISRLPGFKLWLHHNHLVSEDSMLTPQASHLQRQQHLHGVWGFCELTVCQVFRTVPEGGCFTPSVPRAAQPDSHDRSTNLHMWELQNIPNLVTQLKDMSPPMSMALLATCSFLKSHLLSWSGVTCTMDSENIMPTLLSQSYKQCARRWETQAKPVWHKDSDIKETSSTHWWSARKKVLLTRFQWKPQWCWTTKVELSGRRHKDGCTTLLLTLTSPGYLPPAFVFDAPPLQRSFRRTLLEYLAFNSHERGQKHPAYRSSALRGPLCKVNDLPPTQSFRWGTLIFTRGSQAANLFMLKVYRFTFK